MSILSQEPSNPISCLYHALIPPNLGEPCRQALTPLQEVGHILVLGQV